MCAIVFDATGLGLVVAALDAELHGRSWTAPPLLTHNQLDGLLDEHEAALTNATPAAQGDAWVDRNVLVGWSSATRLVNIAKFLVNYVWEKWYHRDEARYIFVGKDAASRLVQRIKEEARSATGDAEWVSSGDVLMSWVLKFSD
ncbi:hypothetical protein Rhopal_006944-T1 [Rhodotorula paludigena]|uniref:Uncharacterized protein n=1 Tax=Rhodotorula paludigena TaxID=86838 RepID=A0AAV5GWN2_9BASI|nr:hypothetical protein Rhopal_006944-T1 [Rhodotorula paludigena]